MIKYEGTKVNDGMGGQTVQYCYATNMKENIKHIVCHSPDGMTWGYGGSGPADCALSILTDYLRRTGRPVGKAGIFYQLFKENFIASAGDKLQIHSEDLELWLAEQNL